METIDFEKETLKVLEPERKHNAGMKFNSFLTGASFGLIIPVVSIFIFYLLFSPKNHTFNDFLNQTKYLNITSPILSLCVIPNLLSFFIFIWTNKLLSARGTVFATMIYAFIIAALKFLL